MSVTVELDNRGNPDFGQNPDARLPGTPAETVTVESIDAARELCQRYIRRWGLGGGNWTGGQVRDASGRELGRVAYNGRFIPTERTHEIVEPVAPGLLLCPEETDFLREEEGALWRQITPVLPGHCRGCGEHEVGCVCLGVASSDA